MNTGSMSIGVTISHWCKESQITMLMAPLEHSLFMGIFGEIIDSDLPEGTTAQNPEDYLVKL